MHIQLLKLRSLRYFFVVFYCLVQLSLNGFAAQKDPLTYRIIGDEARVIDCHTNANSVIIPTEFEGLPVTTIGENAFSFCESLISVAIPNSITTIGISPFYFCLSLTNVNVSEENPSFVSVEGVLFDKSMNTLIAYPGGKHLSEYRIPDGVTSIADGAFNWNQKLVSIWIPDSVTTIGSGAFASSNSLSHIDLSRNITSIGDYAFGNCYHLANLTLPLGLTKIGKYAFLECILLGDISIPDTVTTIGESAFNGCRSLKSISLPEGITSIKPETFYNCLSLSGVSIPDSVTTIGDGAFIGCESLFTIAIPESVITIGRDAFNVIRNGGWGGYSSFSLEWISIPARFHKLEEAHKIGLPLSFPQHFYLPGESPTSIGIGFYPDLVLNVSGRFGQTVEVETAEQIAGPWQKWMTIVLGDSARTKIPLESNNGKRFYRARN